MNRTILAAAMLCGATQLAFGQTTPAKTPSTPSTPSTPPPAATAATPAPPAPAATSPNTVAPGVALAPKALDVKAGHYKLDPNHGKVTWSVNHLGFSTYSGMFGGVAADLVLDPRNVSKIALTATIETATVDTLNPKLNAELTGDGWFNSKAFPTATFKSTKITITGPQTARIDGDLTLRGKTFPIVISATFNNAGIDPVDKQYTVGFDGASIVRRSTFGVSQYVPLVGDNVQLRLEGEFKPAQ